MDVASTFKSEVFRPLATIFIPGAAAVAPFALLILHYNPELAGFADKFLGLYAAVMVLSAIAAGMVLEDVGGIIEAKVWDALIEQETGCHWTGWSAFLRSAPKRDEERVGHRYLRTMTLRLKFELSFSLALVFLWFGLLWLDAVRTLWREESVLLLTVVLLGTASYALWESYKTAWALSEVRYLLTNDADLKLQARPEEQSKHRQSFNLFLLVAAIVFAIAALAITGLHLWPDSPLEHRGGLVSSMMLLLFSLAMLLLWRWLRTPVARGRRRGMALRLSLACSLLAWFALLRSVYDDRPASRVVMWLALVVSVVFFVFGKMFWAGSTQANSSLEAADTAAPAA